MSLFEPAEMACLACGAPHEFSLATSVNADRRPDLRLEILAGDFQRVPCGSCGAAMQLPPAMTYLDIARGDWIMTKPAWDFPSWSVLEMTAREAFELSFGPAASAPARALGQKLRCRIVFGWPAMREKLLATEHDVDDVTLELLKLAVLRNVTGAPLNDETEFRLIAVEDDQLLFAWIESGNEKELSYLRLDRSDLHDLGADGEAWAPLRARLSDAFFVDVGRLMLDPPAPIDHIV